MDFKTPGYEDMELSTQILIKEALSRGLQVDILDRSAQFISISDGQKKEYIQEATKTSLDSYIASIIIGNKVVTKKILEEKGIKVPQGYDYSSLEDALQNVEKFTDKPVVVKPKTTNFGEGITMIKKTGDPDLVKKAIEEAFTFDDSILVEEFLEGIECRFLVMGGETIAIMHRVPANVIGDGKSTVAELVADKNKDPLRGEKYVTPLEKIKLGEREIFRLKQQGLTAESIPEKDQQIFLRTNSNISTGGDSLDYTDEVHDSYKKLAVEATAASGAKICGVDMILSDHKNPASENNYGIIELNYNPVLHCHGFPYKGENRPVAKPLLDLLGF